MGSGRGDRNQQDTSGAETPAISRLQWGPVVVTGIRDCAAENSNVPQGLQWGPVVVTGIRPAYSRPGTGFSPLQWGPVVVTGISLKVKNEFPSNEGFNGVRSW